MLTLRPAEAGDEPFLYELYCSTRKEEMDAWGWDAPQRDAFLRLQYRAQQQHYKSHYADADDCIVSLDGRPVGHLIVARQAEEFRLVDIALLPEHRGAGIGTGLIEDVLAEAGREGKPARFYVLAGNPARRLYERLGFSEVESDGVYVLMEKKPEIGNQKSETRVGKADI
jgi:GNAT superfamily N-acetyltransferase